MDTLTDDLLSKIGGLQMNDLKLVVVLCKYQNRLLKNMGNGNNKMVIKISECANSSVFVLFLCTFSSVFV